MADISEPSVTSARRPLRLWLVRHGITQWNIEQRFCGHSDIALTAQGREQARWLARRLRNKPISAIYTSDLLRTHETATLIASHLGSAVPIHTYSAWREMAFGSWEGLSYEQIVARFPHHLAFFTDPLHNAPPGGETLAELVQRVRSAFVELIQADRPAGSDILLVGHGGPLRVLLCLLLAMPLKRQWQLRLDHGSLSAIDLPPHFICPRQCDTEEVVQTGADEAAQPEIDEAEAMAALMLLNSRISI